MPRRLSEALGGAQIYLKREDLAHTGAHKINNALGQGLLAKRMGKRRIIAETGAGQHGVGTATAMALLGLECHVYMGTVDIRRQQPNVFRMKLLGAEVIPVSSGSRTLKDAINEAMRDWVTNVETTFYLLGSALGPHPYPMMVRDFQSVIGVEAREQIQALTGQLPEACVACVGGGSNAIGLFHAFRDDVNTELIGVEAGGRGIESRQHAARFADLDISRPGILHGARSFVMQNEDGQIMETHSVSAGLGLPVGRPRARAPASIGARLLHDGDRRRSAGGISSLEQNGRHHSRPGERARRRRGDQTGADHAARQRAAGQPVRPRRQRPRHRHRHPGRLNKYVVGATHWVARQFG